MFFSAGRPRLALSCAGFLVATCLPSAASAQLSAIGASKLTIDAPVRGTDSAFDPVNGVFLVVGAYGGVNGTFTSSDGTAIGAPFALNITPPGGYLFSHYPRVMYSPGLNSGAGGFLALWHQNDGPGGVNMIHARVISYPAGPVGTDTVINIGAAEGTWWEAAAAVSYSPISQKFLIVWQTCCGGGSAVKYVLVDTSGNPVAAPVQVSGGYGRDPNVVWNPNNNEWAISYSGTDLSGAISAIARVDGTGVLRRRNSVFRDIATYITDIIYNPALNRYVMAYSAPFSGGIRGAEVDVNGDAIAEGLVSSAVGAYDGLGLSRSPVSGTILMVGHHSTSFNVGALELNQRGAPSSPDRVISTTNPRPTMGSYYPRASFSTVAPRWLITFSKDFGATYSQEADTITTGGGSLAPLGPSPNPGGPGPTPTPTPTPTPNPGGCTTSDPFVALGGGVCVNGGWLPPGSAPAPAPTPTPTPTPTPAPAPPPSGGCTTPNPFASMGTGVCVNGGWQFGSPAPAPAPTPTPTPTPTPAPAPAPAPSAGCTTPNPFASMGTGTCVNGGWQFASPPSSGGCSTPNPFLAMGGGTCVNGGWLPPGSTPAPAPTGCVGSNPFPGGGVCINGGWVPANNIPSSCITPDPFTAMGGGLCINGGWIPRSAGGGLIALASVAHEFPADRSLPGIVVLTDRRRDLTRTGWS